MEQRPKRVSATIREGPISEGRVKQVADVLQDTFSCCGSESSCQHRKSLASDHRLNTLSWTRISEIPSDMMPFAMEAAVSGDSQEQDMLNRGGDDNLDDFQRAVLCLKSEHKTFAGANFDRFIKENGVRAMNEVWPLLKQELLKLGLDPEKEPDYHFHECSAKKFPFAVVELYHKGNGDGARQLLSLIFEFIPSEIPEISRYWGLCLEKLVESCNSSDVQKDIFPVIVERFAGKSGSVNAKIGACQLLRKLATRFNHEVIQKRLFPLFVNSLAKDKEPSVRTAAASSLSEMIHRMRNKDQALKLISALSQDPEPSVRASITDTIVHSVTLMNSRDPKNKTYLESVMQTIKILVKDAYVRGNIDLLVSFSNYMGRVCMTFSTADILKPRDVLWYLDAFLQLSRYDVKDLDSDNGREEDAMPTGFSNFRANMEFNRRHSIVEALISTKAPGQNEGNKVGQMNTAKAIAALRANTENKRLSIPFGGLPPSGCFRFYGPEFEKAHLCRANAAKEFYDFMLFARPIVDFRHGLHPLVVDLMHDARPEVRAAMAEKILPIMEYLGPEAALLHGEIVYILTDDDLDVIQALVPHIGRILKCLVAVNVLSPDRVTPKLVEIGGAILYCEERLNQTTYYTVHQTMLEQFSMLPFCIPGDYIYSNFVPALFHRLRHMRQIPCRMAAANAIVIFLRHCRRSAQREDIRKRIREET
ncbi:unnamed protein product [Orchesella dallaii]|uniref:Uncharacterized protein n=1 Tax=Orchesella dallaii TaxID=48710 RepID=A0ABP1QSK1_9HEXA